MPETLVSFSLPPNMTPKIASLLIAIFAFVALSNNTILLGNILGRRSGSMIFLFGGFFGAGGFLLLSPLRPYAWLPLLLDPATLLFLAYGLPRLLHELWRTSRSNLIATYTGRNGIREVQLRLYRRQIFLLHQTFSRSLGEFGVTETSTIGSWHSEDDRFILRFGDQMAMFEPIATGETRTIRQCVGFPSYENDPDRSLAGIEFIRKADDSA